MRMRPVPFVGGFYADEDRPWSVQDCVNWLPSQAEASGTRTPIILSTPPGLKPFLTFPSSSGESTYPIGPIRGVYNCEGSLFAVSGNALFQVSAAGVPTYIGYIPGTSRVIFADNQIANGNQLLIVNGSSGYVYDTVAKTFTRITDDGYPGAINAVFIDGYLVQIEPARRFAFNSAPADAMSYNTLDRFTSEVSPDLLVSMAVSNNELLLFSQTTAEFFEDSGATQQPFRSKRITMDRGCGGRYTVAKMDNTVYWLGNDGIFYVLAGYQPIRISTGPIEQAIIGLDWDKAFAFVWESAKHKVCYWTFPDGLTWGYDVSSKLWHRRESYGLTRWRVSSMAFWNGQWICGDFQGPQLWTADANYILEGSEKFISERTTGVISDDQSLMLVPRLELLVQVGQKETIPDGGEPSDDHHFRIQYADDGGNNFGYWDEESFGAVGEYNTRVVFTRQGSTRNRVYRIQCSSPRKRDLLGAVIAVQGTTG